MEVKNIQYFFSFVISVLLSFQVLHAEKVIKVLEFNPIELKERALSGEDEGKCELNWQGMYTCGHSGSYRVPLYLHTLEVPVDAYDFQIEVTEATMGQMVYLTQPLGLFSEPVSETERLSVNQEEGISGEGKQKIVKIVNDYCLKGNSHYITLQANPVMVIDSTSVIPYSSIEIALSYKRDLNKAISGAPLTKVNELPVKGTFEYDPLMFGIHRDYIIITTQKLKESCKTLAVWKAQKGMNVILKTIEEIKLTSSSYLDDADAIRKYLQSIYNPYIDQYCILIGGDDDITYRYLYDSSSREGKDGKLLDDNFVPTDIYYSDLKQNWILEYDPIVGVYTAPIYSSRYSPCMYVGRLICSDEKELYNYMHKLLVYEAYPGKGNSDYVMNGLVTKQDQQRDYTDLFTELNTHHITKLIDNSGEDFISNEPTGKQVIDAMKESGLITLQGHGNPGTVACAGKNGKTETWRYIKARDEYSNKELGYGVANEPSGVGLNCLNNIWKPSIIYSLSCSITPFDKLYDYRYKYNMGTSFTVGGLYGGVAILSNTRTGWKNESQVLEGEFAKQLKGCSNIGKAYILSKANVPAEYSYHRSTHNLLGDPELCMWMNKPQALIPIVSQMSDKIMVEGLGEPDAQICLFDGVSKTVTDLLPISGTYTLSTANFGFECNDYMVGIWREGFLPYLKYYGQDRTITRTHKSYVVMDAVCGGAVNPNSSKGTFLVSTDGVIEIKALNSITLADNVIIEDNGRASLECMGDISLNAVTVQSGASLVLKSDHIVFNEGFKADAGCSIVTMLQDYNSASK